MIVSETRCGPSGKGDDGTLPELATRVTASGDLFNRRGRKPWVSVNFITAHDGCTLNDLLSYNDQHNEVNGEDNRDGHSDNRSWNHGIEGPTDDPDIVELRERQKRNMLSVLLLSQGTPMMLAGDEFGRTQQGNNNAYCQDNEISWMDWDHDERGELLTRFVQRLTHLRNRYAVLRRNRFLTGEWNEEQGIKDATWLAPRGAEMSLEQWQESSAKCVGLLLDGRAQSSGIFPSAAARRPCWWSSTRIVTSSCSNCRTCRAGALGCASSTPTSPRKMRTRRMLYALNSGTATR
jgi:isoamylase